MGEPNIDFYSAVFVNARSTRQITYCESKPSGLCIEYHGLGHLNTPLRFIVPFIYKRKACYHENPQTH